MDVVLGVSMDPDTVRLVLVEGEGAGGVTVDQDAFRVDGDAGATALSAAAHRVVEAILGTRESAAQGGYRLASSGVTCSDPAGDAALRNALSAHKIGDVAVVSAFTAAAALAQAVGSATHCARTALLFVEPAAATLAAVDTSDGAISNVRRRPLPPGDDAALAELAAMVGRAGAMRRRPDGVVLVGSGVDLPLIKLTLDAATSLSVTVPEEPEMALARGAALASASARLGAPSTVALPQAHDAVTAGRVLAYSAEADSEPDRQTGAHREVPAFAGQQRSRWPVVAVVGATVVFVIGALAIAVALAMSIRPHVSERPDISKNVVAPPTPAAPPPSAPPNAQPPAQAPPQQTASPPPSGSPPRQWLPPRPRDDDHSGEDWLRRHLGHGILVP